MENYDAEIKRIKRNNYTVFGIFVGLILAVIIAGIVDQYQNSFSTSNADKTNDCNL